MEGVPDLGQLALHLLIGLELVDQAALKATADARQLRLIEREVLLLRHADRDVRELVQPRGAAQLAATRADAGHDLRLVARAHLSELDARAEVGGEGGVELRQVGAILAGIEEDKARSVELPVRPEDLDRHTPRVGHLGRGARGVLLHALVFVHREEIGSGRAAHDGAERRIDHHEGRVGGQDRDACRVLAEIGAHDDHLTKRDVVDPAGVEEVHPAGLHEARADDRAGGDHAASATPAA